MDRIDPGRIKRASETWRIRCHEWGIEINAPFVLNIGNEPFACIAFLPHFGGPKGMVIAPMDLPAFSSDDRVFVVARKSGLFCSFVNVNAFMRDAVPDDLFKEALNDWGYYGPSEKRPKWFTGYDHSR